MNNVTIFYHNGHEHQQSGLIIIINNRARNALKNIYY